MLRGFLCRFLWELHVCNSQGGEGNPNSLICGSAMCCIYTTSVSPVANIFRPQGEPRSRRPAEWLEHYVTEGGLQLSILFVVSPSVCPSVCPSVRPSVRCRSTLSKPWRSETAVPMSMKLVVCILRSGDKTSWSEILNFGPCAERDHPELSSVGTAPLIRSRPWRFINLFTYLLSYLDDPPRRGCLFFYRYTFVIF